MNAKIAAGGELTARRVIPERIGLAWKILNFPNVWRGLWRATVARLLGIPTLYAELRARLYTADGRVVDYGLIATRVVTNAFVNLVVDELQLNQTAFNDFKYHASGTSNVAESVADTALGAEVGTRAVGTQTEGTSANKYLSVGTITYTASFAIVEHGLLNAATLGTLMDRSIFGPINVTASASIEFTYTLTVKAGG